MSLYPFVATTVSLHVQIQKKNSIIVLKHSVREGWKSGKSRFMWTCFCMQTNSGNSHQKIISTEFMTNDFFIRCDFPFPILLTGCYTMLFFIASIFGMSWNVVVGIYVCLLTKVRNTSFRSEICFRSRGK